MTCSCGGKEMIICSFCHREKKNARQYGQKATAIAYISLTALNTRASQNFMHESTKGSP
jgi:hypothetical protein